MLMRSRLMTCLSVSGLALLVVSSGVFGVEPTGASFPGPGTYFVQSRIDGPLNQMLLLDLTARGDASADAIAGFELELVVDEFGVDVESHEDLWVPSSWRGRWTLEGRHAIVRLTSEDDRTAIFRLRADRRSGQAFTTARELRPVFDLGLPDVSLVVLTVIDVPQDEPRPAVELPDELAGAGPRITRRTMGRIR